MAKILNSNQLYLLVLFLLNSKKEHFSNSFDSRNIPNIYEFLKDLLLLSSNTSKTLIPWKINELTLSYKSRPDFKSSLVVEDPKWIGLTPHSFFEYYYPNFDFEKISNEKYIFELENGPEFIEYCKNFLKDYVLLFAQDHLDRVGNTLTFDKHLEFIGDYFDCIKDNTSNDRIELWHSQIIKYLKSKYPLIKQSPSIFLFWETILTLWLTKCIDIEFIDFNESWKRKDNQDWIYIDYGIKLKLLEPYDLRTNTIRERLGVAKKSIEKRHLAYGDDTYEYDTNSKILYVRYRNGELEPFKFKSAKKSRWLFEAFWFLWTTDNKGEYTYNEINNRYKWVCGFDLIDTSKDRVISRTRYNVVNKIFSKRLMDEKLTWEPKGITKEEREKFSEVWIFRFYDSKK